MKIYSYAFPGNIEEDILQIGAGQVPYMRTAWFSGLMKDNERMLLKAIGCKDGRVLFYTSSGTCAMEAVVANYVAAVGKAFIVDGGTFGHRWIEICDYHGLERQVFEVPFAKDIDYERLDRELGGSDAKVLLCPQHETSSGQLFDIERIGAICRKYGIRLVVDAVSSFLADELDMDRTGADVVITSSQKGLNLPPGISFVILSAKALDIDFVHGCYYSDFQNNLKNLTRGQTPYSPMTTLFMQLNERLRRNEAGGPAEVIRTTREKAMYFREKCREYGWEMSAERQSNAITGFYIRKGVDILFEELQKKGIYIMPSARPGYFRVSHMGIQSREEIDALVQAIHEIEMRG